MASLLVADATTPSIVAAVEQESAAGGLMVVEHLKNLAEQKEVEKYRVGILAPILCPQLFDCWQAEHPTQRLTEADSGILVSGGELPSKAEGRSIGSAADTATSA